MHNIEFSPTNRLHFYFLTCLIGSQDVVVAIDQHAAHERVRLEALADGRVCE